jgi:hypothetical protein
VGIVITDFDLLLAPVGLHEIQGFLSSQLLLLELVEVLCLFEDDLLELALPLFEGLFLNE